MRQPEFAEPSAKYGHLYLSRNAFCRTSARTMAWLWPVFFTYTSSALTGPIELIGFPPSRCQDLS